jgi:hypothetical protein
LKGRREKRGVRREEGGMQESGARDARAAPGRGFEKSPKEELKEGKALLPTPHSSLLTFHLSSLLTK